MRMFKDGMCKEEVNEVKKSTIKGQSVNYGHRSYSMLDGPSTDGGDEDEAKAQIVRDALQQNTSCVRAKGKGKGKRSKATMVLDAPTAHTVMSLGV